MSGGGPASSSLLRIGISACFMHPDPERPVFKGKTLLYAEESMLRWLSDEGALPLLVPPASTTLPAREIVRTLDGLVLQGGADVSPRSYGEEPARPEWGGDPIRDAYEIELIRLCLEEDRPVLGICRGLQVLNVALGGTLYQDLATLHPGRRVHRSWDVYDRLGHEVAVEPGSALARWCDDGGGAGTPAATGPRARVNSVHHQGIKAVGRGLVVEARSVPDGVIEAVRYAPEELEASKGGRGSGGGGGGAGAAGAFAYGVQWHPEFMQDVTPDDATDVAGAGAGGAGPLPLPTPPPLLDPRLVLRPFLEAAGRRRQERGARP